MDTFMLDPHQNSPPGMVPANRQSQGRFADEPVDNAANGIAVGSHFFNGRPVIMGGIQVVPAHLVDPDREHGFKSGIDSFRYQSRKQQFVSKESCRMAEVEN